MTIPAVTSTRTSLWRTRFDIFAIAVLATFGLGSLAVPLTGQTPAPNGIYAIWYAGAPSVLDYDQVKAGQVAVQWGPLQSSSGVGVYTYDWTTLDNALNAAIAPSGTPSRYVTLQINGADKPDFLFTQVPSAPNEACPGDGWSDGTSTDPQGFLMYWHSNFVAAYVDFIHQLAAHLHNYPYKQWIAALRQNFNAVGTEKFHPPLSPINYRLAGNWTVPSGVTNGPDWVLASANEPIGTAQTYQIPVLDAYVSSFIDHPNYSFPFELLVRSEIDESVLQAAVPSNSGYTFEDYFVSGKLSWLYTGSEPEPRALPQIKSYHKFLDFTAPPKYTTLPEIPIDPNYPRVPNTATGETLADYYHPLREATGNTWSSPAMPLTRGYAESFGDAWGYRGSSTRDYLSLTPPQYLYWRILSDLNMGVGKIAVYAGDLQVARVGYRSFRVGNGVFTPSPCPGEPDVEGKTSTIVNIPIYQDEFRKTFEFANKYAGQTDPATAPGAWVAFRGSRSVLRGTANRDSAVNNYDTVTDFGMHLALTTHSGNKVAGEASGVESIDRTNTSPVQAYYPDPGTSPLPPDGLYPFLNESVPASIPPNLGGGLPVPANGFETTGYQWSIGPYYQRYGAFARQIKAGKLARLQLHPSFAAALNASPGPRDTTTRMIRVIYYDGFPDPTVTTPRSFEVSFGSGTSASSGQEWQPPSDWVKYTRAIPESGSTPTNTWKTFEIPIPQGLILNQESTFKAEIYIKAVTRPIWFHMVEVTK